MSPHRQSSATDPTPAAVHLAGAPPVHKATEPVTAYIHTLDDVVIPDPGEPVRHQALPHRPEPTAQREGNRSRRSRNRKGEPRKDEDE